MDAFLNLGLFLAVFYLILLYAGRPDRRTHRGSDAVDEQRVA
jgi:hypothetical protein